MWLFTDRQEDTEIIKPTKSKPFTEPPYSAEF